MDPLAIAYGLLALVALLATWRDHDLQMVGIVLLGGWALSNASMYFLSPSERPAFYTVIEIAVSLMAYFATLTGRSRALLVLIGASVVSVMSNVAFASLDTPTLPQVHLWQALTNACFVVECLAAVISGVRAGAVSGVFNRPGGRRDAMATRTAPPPGP